MRVDLADCIVLHRHAWRETSLIVEVLARDYGRVALVAKGARRPKSRWSGLLEPLGRVSLSWQGRGEMQTLIDVQPDVYRRLTDNRLMAGWYASELTLRLCARGDPHPMLFHSLAGLLDVLSAGAPAVVALRFFERDLLAALGYGLDFQTAADTGRPVIAGQRYNLVANVGFETTNSNAPETVDGRVLLGLCRGRFAQVEDARAARELLRQALAPLLGDRELKSVVTLRAMRRLGKRPTKPGPSADESSQKV